MAMKERLLIIKLLALAWLSTWRFAITGCLVDDHLIFTRKVTKVNYLVCNHCGCVPSLQP